MKKYFFTPFFILNTMISFCQQGYTVKAKINNPQHYTLYLSYQNNDTQFVTTTYTMENGWAIFRGKLDEPVVAHLGVRKNPALTIKIGQGLIVGPRLDFFLDSGVITIKGDADSIYKGDIEGGQANKEWSVIKKKENALIQEDWRIHKTTYDNFKPGDDSVVFKKMARLHAQNEIKDNQLKTQFIKDYPHSIVSMYFLSKMLNKLPPDELKQAYNKLGKEHKNSTLAKEIADKVNSMEATAIGNQAIPILKKDINGKVINLQTLQGKYVLIDFWGSWCGPCRKSHPGLKKMYAKYKDSGFEILGIAMEQGTGLENSKSRWKEAIEQDGLPWLQVLNNEGVKEFDAVKAYGVTAFPTKILLDKEGKIMARYVGDGDGIEKKLKEIFGN